MPHTALLRYPFFLLLLSGWGFWSCTGALRNSSLIERDPYFEWHQADWHAKDDAQILELSQNASDPGVLNDRALAFVRLQQVDQAERLFYEILTRHRTYQKAFANLGRLYALLDEHQRLADLYRRWTEHPSSNPNQLYQEAIRMAGQNRTTESRALIEALYIYRRHIDSGLWLANDLLADGQYAQALAAYEKLLEQKPGLAPALFACGWIYYRAESWNLSEQYLQLARQSRSKEGRLDYFLADSYFHQKKLPKALKTLKSSSQPRTYDTIALQGQILLELDFSHDLRNLLKFIEQKEDRLQLTRQWYGSENPWPELKSSAAEFQKLY